MSESAVLVQLSVGFILFVTGVHASCPIELSPPKVVVKHGDPVSVNCSTSESAFKGMGWEASQGGTGFKKVSHLLWTVKSLTEWTIAPMCYFNSLTEQCDKDLKVILYRFPETININSNSGSKNTMKEGENYNFTCEIFDIAPIQNLTVRWYKGDKIIQTETFNDDDPKPSNQSSVLSYTPTRQDHNATFRCEAYMDLGPEGPQFNVSTQEYDIEVFYGPEKTCPDTYTVQENSPHKLVCSQGFPPPEEIWYKDGEKVDLPENLTRTESGLYFVDASSTNSRINFTVNINVLYGPEKTCPDTYTVQENSPHKLVCSQGFPPPEEFWYKDGEEVHLPEILTRSESGLYLVNASNINSWISFTVNINVLYPPSVIDELEDSEVQVGDTLRLKCSSRGNPMPNYSWSYLYMPMPNVKRINEDGVSFLIIHNATGNNIGSYTCSASNEGGNVSKTVKVTVKGAKPECPIKITPDKMVLKYQSTVQPVTCEPFPDSTNVKEIYWKTQQNITTYNSSWRADTQKDWDPRPACYAKFQGNETCHKQLKYILYKTPDRVSIRAVDSSASAVEGSELQLQCEIFGVAPAENLTARWMWYRGNDTIKAGENVTQCENNPGRSPVNVLCPINLTVNRTHNAMKIQCEAQLVDLGPEGPQPSSKMKSNFLNINVLYKPIIKLPNTVPVFRGYPEELFCEADGNPPPNITWDFNSNTARLGSDGKLIVFEAGLYNCTATNFNSTKHVVAVFLEEDYLPLIAGFVAVIVVAISVIFLFIYSIYYKNTKMRRYNLKNPKLNTHNGNVAHNGWDLQFPMTKLS
ncbi:hemicentin-1-like isoform X2 [Melanotaenia boesemani]|uniref:hemicentin-1-like isoform X2 n=1 Tax=Melanotaenia boesemani TaxID=1250792 RepID=UPI001C04D99A|nr:hemicentin-1-like isoform X2 [Melanotaenia boesemani]